MKTAVICILGMVGSWGHASTEPVVEGRVLLPSGAPVPGARVLLFDWSDLRMAPLAAISDGSGHFVLPLATLAGVLPERFELGANYPNPFNPSTMIPYQLPASMYVRLEVFNLLGQRVATLVDGEQPAGFHTASWDATGGAGEAVGAGVYLYRLSGDGVQATRSMLLMDGQAGMSSGGPGDATAARDEGREATSAYGLTVSGPGLVPYVDPAFRVEAAMAPLEVVVKASGSAPPAKVTSSGGILGDVDNTGGVDFFDALLVALYSLDASVFIPNNGDISLGDVNADGQVDLSDAWLIAAWLNDPSDPVLPAGIGEPVAATASLSPDPSTVSFADDGAWHRFTVEAGEPVSVVVNPAGTAPGLEITTRSGRGNYCPAEADDDVTRENGQAVYLSGCAEGEATVELWRESDGTVLRTYTFEVTGSPADLVVASISVSDSTLTPGQSFTLSATVRNQGTGPSEATTLRYYRSTNRTISTRDRRIGTDAVNALSAAATSAESIRLTAPSAEGTWYYGACVVSVGGESAGNNCSAGVRVTVDSAAPTTGSPAGDRAALVALYQATDGPNWTDNTNWLSDRPLYEWQGVETDANGRVTWLSLFNTNLRGEIPKDLGRLSEIEFIYLARNQLTGPVPSELGNLSRLEHLSLNENQLSGPIPPELGALSNLRVLNLGWNGGLTGQVPTWLGDLSNLEKLSLERNQLSGPIPSGLGDLSNLQELWLGSNQLTGPIPSWLGGLSNLRVLSLRGNPLSGPILSGLGDLSNLEELYLSGIQLSAPVPSWLGGLSNLRELWLAGNQLTGPIPSELGDLSNLEYLILNNNQLRGPVPSELGDLSNLRDLSLGSNQLTGPIPSELGDLSNLRKLSLGSNQLTGPIPSELGNLSNLESLYLGRNQLRGPIPSELGNLTKLKTLRLGWNRLSGIIPSNLTNLTELEWVSFRFTHLRAPDADFLRWLRNIDEVNMEVLNAELENLPPVTTIDPGVLSTPPPTWLFLGDIPEEDQTILREEMEYSRAYFAARFGVEATGFTVLVGSREELAQIDPRYVPPIWGQAQVVGSGTGGAVVVLTYGFEKKRGLLLKDPGLLVLSAKEPIAHEYFHVLQGQLASGFEQLEGGEIAYYSNTAGGGIWPKWPVEGFAAYADFAYLLNRVNGEWHDGIKKFLVLEKSWAAGTLNEGDLSRREDAVEFYRNVCVRADSATASYALAFAGAAFAVEQAGEESYVKYWKLLGERPTWQQAFQEAFGTRTDAFYQAFEAWLPSQFPVLPSPTRRAEIRVDWPDGVAQLPETLLSTLHVRLDQVQFQGGTVSYGSGGHSGIDGWHPPVSLHPELNNGSPTGFTALLSLWLHGECTEHLLGWYKDGELTDQLGEATRVEVFGRDSSLDWRLPARLETLPRLVSRPTSDSSQRRNCQ